MTYLKCDNYTVVLWHWIAALDCDSLNRPVGLYLAGMWHH